MANPGNDALLGDVIGKILFEGILPKDALGISRDQMDNLYSQAYHMYNTGKYADACHLFKVLALCDRTEPKYMIGMAASQHLMKDYKDAVQSYLLSATLDPENPMPYYHVADCCIQLKDTASAMVFLEMAINKARTNEHTELKERSQLVLERLKNQPLERGQL